ncbi:MAG: hypothetical protein A2268_09650 [Candidatus Raymondbacteria bacterium RifOxyA12_full_50_37]|uniref:Serine aminopeptidase S33 domain-containing protein n=1 Tax=Candidatus Raymondbacteria bacterium RIFOXYD12_FULL_49_13 TaxID=1817890 RepID=A0A1F7F1I8_UNCRA|nr:MAG: hypothetical protein A2268_09650 [Candidatus Raymondbacteria bacterium RifOxyA12_full_50_37]OGJ93151.1 MAG: hypothetical protein A2350_17845 [Candidatus Raymondbacteria bacterium RifOxyB12_full_50_8]OGJ93896.1 MAG: hypothetical protein A2248_06645 [Candidatus Raymondbacteria bacterium RIFOXYA2_FULL_49_16]OGJ98235.1 MAG: hypothetical protein A2453_00520 [Candidatus Raymondbacteria bacterium RIFOXYC2_FULL_50_21]OGK00468.1 MAG: hypothetical protein A2519_10695 [Candidatus Raymondbacteria b
MVQQENTYFRRPYSLLQEEISFHKRSENGIICGAEPFYFQGNSKEAVLMVHGYTSTPRDLRTLGLHLNNSGYTVKGILLPGHGTKPTDLDACTWLQWYQALEEAFTSLSTTSEIVHLAGFSMGAALALHCAANHRAGKLVLLSPFFRIAYNPIHLVPEEVLVYTIGRVLRHLKKKYSGNCSNPDARARHVAYYHYALSSINQALELVKVIRSEMHTIKNPALFIHSRRDKTTSPAASRKMYSLLASSDKRFVWLEKANHIVPHDYENDRVFREVVSFLTVR